MKTLQDFYNHFKHYNISIYRTGSQLIDCLNSNDEDYVVYYVDKNIWLEMSQYIKENNMTIDIRPGYIDDPASAYYRYLYLLIELVYGNGISVNVTKDTLKQDLIKIYSEKYPFSDQEQTISYKRWYHAIITLFYIEKGHFNFDDATIAFIQKAHAEKLTLTDIIKIKDKIKKYI